MKIAQFQFSLFGINCYVVYDTMTREAAVIDPGIINEEEREAIAAFIDREKLTVTHLINTHLHIDHAFGNDFISRKYGVKTEAHRDDAGLGERIVQQAMMFGLPESPSKVEISEFLEDGDIITVGSGRLKVIHVPGHSPGSIALYDEDDGFLIAGDILFQGSIGRTDLPGGSHSQLINGIRTKLLTLPDSTTVYPGHGPATTIGAEKRGNPFLR